jgi:hypothetical protein
MRPVTMANLPLVRLARSVSVKVRINCFSRNHTGKCRVRAATAQVPALTTASKEDPLCLVGCGQAHFLVGGVGVGDCSLTYQEVHGMPRIGLPSSLCSTLKCWTWACKLPLASSVHARVNDLIAIKHPVFPTVESMTGSRRRIKPGICVMVLPVKKY